VAPQKIIEHHNIVRNLLIKSNVQTQKIQNKMFYVAEK